jgi:hypothetical protein
VVPERFRAQLLSGSPAASVVEVVERLLAVQAQDQRGARLAVRARSTGLTAADVDRALTVDRSVVVTWANRGTLHLVTSADYWWLHALTTPPLATASARRLEQEGVSPGDARRGVDAVVEALSADGPLTRAQLRERVAAAGVRTEGQALVHVLVSATLQAGIVRGPVVGKQQAFALASDWLGAPPPALHHEEALALLARRYLAGHGPATDADLARWAGLPLRDARLGLGGIADVLVRRDDGRVDLADATRGTDLPSPRLLGAYEPVLLGWTSREWIVPSSGTGIVTDNGLFRPFPLVGGRAAGTWRVDGRRIVVSPFAAIPRRALSALQADAEDVGRFLGIRLDGLTVE